MALANKDWYSKPWVLSMYIFYLHNLSVIISWEMCICTSFPWLWRKKNGTIFEFPPPPEKKLSQSLFFSLEIIDGHLSSPLHLATQKPTTERNQLAIKIHDGLQTSLVYNSYTAFHRHTRKKPLFRDFNGRLLTIGNSVLFHKTTNRKSAPRWRGPAKILDIGEAGVTAKFQSQSFKAARYWVRKKVEDKVASEGGLKYRLRNGRAAGWISDAGLGDR